MGLKRIIQKLKLRYGSQETVIRTLREMGVRIGERCRIYTSNFGPCQNRGQSPIYSSFSIWA
jgi:hypothetical protein